MVEYMVGIPMIRSDRIYAGRVLKDDSMSDVRTDVTNQCINCVAYHLLRQRSALNMDSVEGKIYGRRFRLTVTELEEGEE